MNLIDHDRPIDWWTEIPETGPNDPTLSLEIAKQVKAARRWFWLCVAGAVVTGAGVVGGIVWAIHHT